MKSPQPTVSMADKVALIDSLCAKARILPVITIAREQDILPLADALAAGGLTALDVAMHTGQDVSLIGALIDGKANVNHVTTAGFTPLFLAVLRSQ